MDGGAAERGQSLLRRRRGRGQVPASSSAAWAREVASLTAARARAPARARLRASSLVVGAAQARDAVAGLVGSDVAWRCVFFFGRRHLCCRRCGVATRLVRGQRERALRQCRPCPRRGRGHP